MLQRYIETSQSRDLTTLETLLVRLAGDMGFPLVSATVVAKAPDGQDRFFGFGNTPAGFQQLSRDPARGRRAPGNQLLKRSSTPFAYNQRFYVRARAGDMWEEQSQFGYRNGIAIALHLPGRRPFLTCATPSTS